MTGVGSGKRARGRRPGRGTVPGLLIALLWASSASGQSITVLASADNLGAQLSNPSGSPSISADGRFVAFVGGVSNSLTGGCTGGVLVRDLALGMTTCVAAQGSNPVMSGDGRFVAFQSRDATIDPVNCANVGLASGHVFRRDLQAGQTVCVSVDVNGAGIIGGTSSSISISHDGQHVAFVASGAFSTVALPCTSSGAVFVRDTAQNMTVCANVTPDGLSQDNGLFKGISPSLSGSGTLVAFQSDGSNLTAACAAGGTRAYVRDLTAGVTSCVSLDGNGNPVSGSGPRLSADGRFVMFGSTGLNLGLCVLGQSHAYVRELATGAITCASLAADGSPLAPAFLGSMSGDGRFVAFVHAASGNNPALTAMGCPLSGFNTSQVLVRDRAGSTTRCVSGDQSGAGRNVSSGGGVLSADGLVVAFQSDATNLVPPDLNGVAADVFVNGPRVTLTVTKTGGGTVTSAPGGITCGADCLEDYLRGRVVVLAPAADPGSVFASFTGDPDCADGTVTLATSVSCTATFLPLFTLTVGRTGDGSGFVFSEPSGITCGNDCTEVFASGTQVTLGPIPIGGSVFTGFTGDPDCADGVVTLTGNITCTAAFAPLTLGTGSTGLGGGTAGGESLNPSLSDDGRFVAFESTAADLSVECPTPVRQIYVLDRVAQGIRCVSRGPDGAPGTGASEAPTISGDGRRVAFQSSAPNLVAGCTVAGTQAFVREVLTLVTHCVSVGQNGVAANAPSGSPALSRDGRFVAFQSEATNLTPDCATGVRQVFVRDLVLQTTTCVSAVGGTPGSLASSAPAIGRTGDVVAFQSSATNLAGSGCAGGLQVYVWERASGAITCASRGPASGQPGNGASEGPALSDDGAVVAFESDATNLDPACQNQARQIFVRDRGAGTLACVSLATDGLPGNAASTDAALSGNGLVVAFATGATNLTGGGPPAAAVAARGALAQVGELAQILIRNLGVAANVTALVSQTGGSPGNEASRSPALSQSGQVIAFQTSASNLIPVDANGARDVVVAEGGVVIGPPPPTAGRPRITAPLDFSQFGLTGPTPVSFAWTPVTGATQYGFEFTGAGLTFANPNGTEPDPVSGFGGAGGALVVTDPGLVANLGPGFPTGSYQVRVIGLGAGGRVVGTFSDAVTVILGLVPSAIPADARVTLTGPPGGTVLAVGTSVTFAWTPLVGVTQYLLEFTGAGGQFAQPNAATLTDPGAAGRVPVMATSFMVMLPPGLAPGPYQVRVIGLSATSAPVGSFSDALTVVVQ
jgi:Tol biopolymer transport system component